MKTEYIIAALTFVLMTPAIAISENETLRHGGLIGMLYPSANETVDRVAVEWDALGTAPLDGLYTEASAPCLRKWQRGQEGASCREAFVPLRSADSGAFQTRPRFLSSMRSFSYGADSKTAIGMDLSGLVVTLRGQLRGDDSGAGAQSLVQANSKR